MLQDKGLRGGATRDVKSQPPKTDHVSGRENEHRWQCVDGHRVVMTILLEKVDTTARQNGGCHKRACNPLTVRRMLRVVSCHQFVKTLSGSENPLRVPAFS
jgi:hypothetical protein